MMKLTERGSRTGADLHLHSLHSDGSLSPTALMEACARAGLAAAALTDHDTVEGLEEAQRASERAGVELVTGCEVSVEFEGQDLHLLGYCLDPGNDRLRGYLRTMEGRRRRRIGRIVARLNALGVAIREDAVLEQARGASSIGRPHVAQALVETGYVSTYSEAFHRYLGDGAPAHVPKETATIEEAMEVIRGAGGCAVLAHAALYDLSRVLPRLERAGLAGLEVHHPAHDEEAIRALTELTRTKGWVMTGGSDFHREGLTGNHMPPGALRVPLAVVDELRRRSDG